MQKTKKIIAIVGMAGSGKTEVADYLQKKFRWPRVYLGEPTFDRMKELGLEENQENEKIVREQIRKEKGMGAYAKLAIPKIEKSLVGSRAVLVESLYSWDEYKIMRRQFENSFLTIAVYASPALRFSRLTERPKRPIKTFVEFKSRDWAEIEGTDKGGPIAVADHTIINHSSVDNLHREIDRIMIEEGMQEGVAIDAED